MNSITDCPTVSQEGTPLEFASTNDIPDVPIALDDSQKVSPTNKYKWAEFAGFQGERYLDSVLQAILPFALFRTWHNLTAREAPELGAYSGVVRLSSIAARSERKIYLDLERLQNAHLVSLYKAYRNVFHADGTYRPELVTIKDFTGLYSLAHEYHLWSTQDPRYVAPRRENAEYIRDDADLFALCIKFECYRKVLLHAKPGPKRQAPQAWYNQSLEDLLSHSKEIAEKDAKGAYCHKIDEKDVNLNKQLHEQLSKQSAYRNTPTEKFDSNRESPKASTSEKGRVLPATTIRSGTEQGPIGSKTKRNETEKESAAAENAKDTLGYTEDELRQDVKKRGAAAAGISANNYRKLNGGQDEDEEDEQRERELEARAEAQANRQERERPAQVERSIEDYCRQYDDPELIQSDITRAAKIYLTAEEVLEHFNSTLFWNTFDNAKNAAAKHASKYVNRLERVNRVPYMFSCLENGFGFSLEELVYLRTEDPLYAEYSVWDVSDTLRAKYQEEYRSRSTTSDYRAWLQQLLDLLEKRTQHKERSNPTIRDEFE